MIYTIAEISATVMDCIFLFAFLIYTLSYKPFVLFSRIAVTVCFFFIMLLNIAVLNYHFVLEGVFSVLYFIVLFGFSRFVLQGKWWHQLVLILLGFGSLFVTNTAMLIASSAILKEDYSNIILMRNPARIFLLFLSKLTFASFLLPISVFIKKRKLPLQLTQSIALIVSLLISIIVGTLIEKMILEHLIPSFYANIMMISLAIIDILLFYILIQFSAHNQAAMDKIALQTRLNDEEKQLQETLRWSKSVRSLRHDLNNHLLSVRQYISSGDSQKALSYIDKIAGSLPDIPNITDTNDHTLNAILDLKRMVCNQEGIALKCYLPDDMPDYDDVALNTVLGNLMDNAIEAERNETEKEIRISVEIEGDYLHITVQNRIHAPVLVDGKLPETSKKDKQNHGLGLFSVTETVTQNDGVINFFEKDGWLIVDVLMLCEKTTSPFTTMKR